MTLVIKFEFVNRDVILGCSIILTERVKGLGVLRTWRASPYWGAYHPHAFTGPCVGLRLLDYLKLYSNEYSIICSETESGALVTSLLTMGKPPRIIVTVIWSGIKTLSVIELVSQIPNVLASFEFWSKSIILPVVLPCSKAHIKFAVSAVLLISTRYPGNAGSNGNLIFKIVCGVLSVCEGSFVETNAGVTVGSMIGMEVDGRFVDADSIVDSIVSVG